MIRATLQREASTPEGTPGVLVVDGQAWNTLELPWLDNAPKRSCIPDGVYRCALVQSPRFDHVHSVLGVPRAGQHIPDCDRIPLPGRGCITELY